MTAHSSNTSLFLEGQAGRVKAQGSVIRNMSRGLKKMTVKMDT